MNQPTAAAGYGRAKRRLAALATAVLASCSSVRAQAAGLEVLSEPGRPSSLLATHLQTHAEEFVLVDVGLWVSALVGDALGGAWEGLERERLRWIDRLLDRIVERTLPPRDADDVLAGIAHVAAILLANDAAAALALPEPWLGDMVAVCNGTSAPLRWAKPVREAPWQEAVPNGAYAVDQDLRRLFRTTVWLRTSVAALPSDLAAAWRQLVTDSLDADLQQRLAEIDGALQLLFGTLAPPMPGVLGDLPPTKAADRLVLAAAEGAWWQRLAAVHQRAPAPGTDLRTSILAVTHELASEAPDDAWLSAWGRDAWRQRWLDLADHAYVAVREVDALAGVLCIGPEAKRPRLLVDPLPRTLAALRAAFVAGDPVHRIAFDAAISGDFVPGIDDCLALLAHQRAGTEPPDELVERLWQRLLHGFDEQHDSRIETRLEGLPGPVRRPGCRLVRIPIRWQGRDATAIAFDWGVEHCDADGIWRRAQRAPPASRGR